ncbi:signal recognition particle GTPase Srp54 [Hamiltosporidium tvaerminnensis]|uniref:signal-recognition-particle GTPase n=3 Tax=Hamiltosporidium tvaerminnensis TaxID=1176355 RepID=A0A4Q9LUY7_9MICR|nr:signal recognition particle GTPase Srp54 [Hamiltosporidium tvaerminnensis]TBU20596.1 signal recognition particle GTPase Srp54 [Hamiltosporidium tvaerminnensis]
MIFDLGKSIASSLNSLLKTQVTDSKIEATLHDICNQLLSSNVSPKYVDVLKQNIRANVFSKEIPAGVNKGKLVYNAVYDELLKMLDPKSAPIKLERNKTNVVVFVGLQGSGKTTTVCKYANYYKKKGFKTGIVCADTFRAGAFDQIKQNALKIKVPYFGSSDPDPVKVAVEGFERFKKDKFDLIIIDTSGRHTQERELFQEMKNIITKVTPTKIVLICDAGIGQSAEIQAIGFKNEVDVGSIIITKLDGAKNGGGALSSVASTGCPIEFVGIGENMDDIESFDAERFINKMFGLGDVEGLIETVKKLNIDEKEMMKKIGSGNFTLGDYYDIFQQIMSLGPMSKMLSMIPGFSNMPIPDEKDFRKMIYIFDSLTEKELNSDGSFFEKQPSRIFRIAKGSGTSVENVQNFFVQFKTINSVMKKVGNNPGMMDLFNMDPAKMTTTQKAKLRQKANGVLPKDMVDQLNMFLGKN